MTTTSQTVSNNRTPALGQLFFGLIDRPAVTFQAITARPGWWVWTAPLLVLIVSLAVLLVMQTPHILVLARQQTESQLAAMPEGQAEAARAGIAMTMSLPFMLTTGIGFGSMVLVAATLFQATFLYFTALVSGGESTFGVIFKMSAWSRLPMALGVLVQAAFIAVTGRLIPYPGLSFPVSTGDLMQNARNPLFVLLNRKIKI